MENTCEATLAALGLGALLLRRKKSATKRAA